MKFRCFISFVLAGLILFTCQAVKIKPAAAAQTIPSKSAPTTKAQALKAATPKAGWEQRWQSIVAGAKKEGELLIYTTSVGPRIRADIAPVLREKFGVKLEVISGQGGELLQKILQEQQTGVRNVDMTLLSPAAYIDTLKPKGLMSPLEPYMVLPDIRDDKYWVNGKFPMFDKEGKLVSLTSFYTSYILYNTQMVKEGEIHSYRDLLKPQYKGKMVMLDPTTGPGPTETFVDAFIPRLMGVADGEKYLRALAKQDLAFTKDARLAVEWIAKGKYPLGVVAFPQLISTFVAAGAPVARVRVEEGGPLAVGGTVLGIIVNPPHPNAATAFLNWVLTDEGQRLFAAAYPAPPPQIRRPFYRSRPVWNSSSWRKDNRDG